MTCKHGTDLRSACDSCDEILRLLEIIERERIKVRGLSTGFSDMAAENLRYRTALKAIEDHVKIRDFQHRNESGLLKDETLLRAIQITARLALAEPEIALAGPMAREEAKEDGGTNG